MLLLLFHLTFSIFHSVIGKRSRSVMLWTSNFYHFLSFFKNIFSRATPYLETGSNNWMPTSVANLLSSLAISRCLFFFWPIIFTSGGWRQTDDPMTSEFLFYFTFLYKENMRAIWNWKQEEIQLAGSLWRDFIGIHEYPRWQLFSWKRSLLLKSNYINAFLRWTSSDVKKNYS